MFGGFRWCWGKNPGLGPPLSFVWAAESPAFVIEVCKTNVISKHQVTWWPSQHLELKGKRLSAISKPAWTIWGRSCCNNNNKAATPVITAEGRERQDDQEFKVILGLTGLLEVLSLNKNKTFFFSWFFMTGFHRVADCVLKLAL